MDAASSGLVLIGVSSTAPSIEQMRAFYANEIQMFQPKAKSLPQGGSGVQDIAYDPDAEVAQALTGQGKPDNGEPRQVQEIDEEGHL